MLKDKHSELASVKEMQEPCSWYFSSCELCHLFPILIEADELSTLLSFNDSEIRAVLTCDHGQHAGKNWTYLYYHLFDVYLYTNMIVACRLEQEPDKWGKMSPGSRFRSDLLYDNGAQTFLHSSRKYLADDVYIKDLNATRELCKSCFKYFYVTEMLENEVSLKLHKYDWYWLEYIEEKLSPGSLPWKVITPPTFEDSNCTWELYEEKLMAKLSLANVPEEMRVPALLDCISKETYAKISDLCSPLKPEEKYFKELLQILSSHFNIELGRNKFAERAKFHSRIQGDSESIEDFSSALKILANSCQYPESWIDEALTTQFIIGVKNDKLRQHLFAHETKTFNQAVNFASTYEKDMISNSKLLDFKNKGQKNELDVGKVKTKKSNCKQPEEKNSCWRCLKSNHNDSNCSLKNAKCFQCSKIGHIKVACPLVSKSGLDKVNESDINHFL